MVDFTHVTGAVTWVADNYAPWSAIGSSPNGVAVAYGTCSLSPIVIGHSIYSAPASVPCDYIQVVPHPTATSGAIESVDCTLPTPITYVTGGSILTIDPAGGHLCDPCCGFCGLPTSDSSWGRIKRLYN